MAIYIANAHCDVAGAIARLGGKMPPRVPTTWTTQTAIGRRSRDTNGCCFSSSKATSGVCFFRWFSYALREAEGWGCCEFSFHNQPVKLCCHCCRVLISARLIGFWYSYGYSRSDALLPGATVRLRDFCQSSFQTEWDLIIILIFWSCSRIGQLWTKSGRPNGFAGQTDRFNGSVRFVNKDGFSCADFLFASWLCVCIYVSYAYVCAVNSAYIGKSKGIYFFVHNIRGLSYPRTRIRWFVLVICLSYSRSL